MLSRLPGSRKAAAEKPAAVPDPALPDSGADDSDTLSFSAIDPDQVDFGQGTQGRATSRTSLLRRSRRGEEGDGGDGGRDVRPGDAPWVRRAARQAAVLGALGAAWVATARAWYREKSWVPGWVFAAGTLFPALLAVAWLLPGTAMLMAGRLMPTPLMVIFVPLTVALCYFTMRQLPVSWPRFGLRAGTQDAGVVREAPAPAPAARPRAEVPAWAVLATVAIAVGFAVWQVLEMSRQVIVARDPGEYLQYAFWIAHHGTAKVPVSIDAFGGAGVAGLKFTSPGFVQSGAYLSPQFLPGLPLVLAGGIWAGGITGGLLMAPVLGGCAVLSFAGLAGRLVGGRWAPAAALVLALTLPEQYVSRTTLSEPLVQILLFGGLCLVIDSLAIGRRGLGAHVATLSRGMAAPDGAAAAASGGGDDADGRASGRAPGRGPAWQAMTLAGFGGIALGLTVLANVGSLNLMLPLFPLLALMLVARLPQAAPMAVGLVAGIGLGVAAGVELARPYLSALRPQFHTLGLAAAGFGLATALIAPLVFPSVRATVRRVLDWRLPVMGLSGVTHRVPIVRVLLEGLAVLVPVALLVGLAIRPQLHVTRGSRDPFEIAYVAALQKLQGLPIDGRQQYYEQSLNWVIWYVGLPVVLLAFVGAALIGRRCLRALLRGRGAEPAAQTWAFGLLIIGWATATTLLIPAIFPDQPWASRRLVPMVLPGLILLAVWTCSRIRLRATELGAGRVAGTLVVACSVLALAIPAAVTTFDPGYVGKGSARHLAVRGLAFKTTYANEQFAVSGLCSAIGPGASVIIIDQATANSFAQLVRGVCGAPTARMDGVPAATVEQAVAAIERAGRRPVLLGSTQSSVAFSGTVPRRVLNLRTTQDAHTLTGPPAAPWPQAYTVWMSSPSGA